MARKKKRNQRRKRPLARASTASSIIRFLLRIAPLILVIALLAGGVKAVSCLLLNSDYFKVKNITMAGEDSKKAYAFIQKELNSKKGINIFNVDIKVCESCIAGNNPELRNVRVRRVLPDTIEVSYDTREPFCQIESGYYYLVSEDGVILPQAQVAVDPNMVVITGIRLSKKGVMVNGQNSASALKKAISLIKDIQSGNFSKQYKITRINVDDPQNPAIFMEDSTKIEIGECSFRDKEPLLKEVLNELYMKNKKAKVIDLRFDDVVVIPR